MPYYDYRADSSKPLQNYEIHYLHFHRTAELGLCIAGSGSCFVENKEQRFEAGDMQIILPYMRHYHKSAMQDPAKWIWLTVDIQELLSFIGVVEVSGLERGLMERVAVAGIIDQSLFPKTSVLLKKLIEDAVGDAAEDIYYKEKLAIQFYLMMISLFEESKDMPKIRYGGKGRILELEPALKEINLSVNTGKAISVATLAELCGYSLANFRRIFHSVFNCSPMDYLSACRIRRAKNLISEGKLGMTAIALAVGYQSSSTFNRIFSATVGQSPTEYKRSLRAQKMS